MLTLLRLFFLTGLGAGEWSSLRSRPCTFFVAVVSTKERIISRRACNVAILVVGFWNDQDGPDTGHNSGRLDR
jgi:hypothetical protein